MPDSATYCQLIQPSQFKLATSQKSSFLSCKQAARPGFEHTSAGLNDLVHSYNNAQPTPPRGKPSAQRQVGCFSARCLGIATPHGLILYGPLKNAFSSLPSETSPYRRRVMIARTVTPSSDSLWVEWVVFFSKSA